MSPSRAHAVGPAPLVVGLRGRQLVGDLVALTKPKVQSLLLFTTLAAMYAAGRPSFALVAATLVGGALSAGGASAFNHWFDRDIDALMPRTADRPVPSGRMQPHVALWVALWLSLASVAVLGFAVNWVAAGLSVAGLVWYCGVYTMWLKRRTTQNIVIGGAAGAFPPMVGWAAVTGDVTWTSVCLFAIVFAWTAPHFWALALLIQEDYATARVPMLPVVRGEAVTHRAIVNWSGVTIAVSVAPFALGTMGWLYLVVAVILGIELMRRSLLLRQRGDRPAAVALHLYALAYLAVLFLAMVVDRQLGF
ncbi:MAG: heme o synthase [Solirubrobacteraceae bacterium]